MNHTPDLFEPLSILILAGGRSRRMGRDKAWLQLQGIPLVLHVIHRLLPIASEFVVSTNAPRDFDLLAPSVPIPLRAVRDQFEDAGPLAGLHAGLRAVQSAWAFAVAADMPFVDPKIVRAMLDLAPGQDAVVPRISLSGSSQLELEPLHALYSTACVSAIEDRLRSGDRRIVSFLPSIKAAYAEDSFFQELDPQHLSFFNINTPADLEFANHILTSR